MRITCGSSGCGWSDSSGGLRRYRSRRATSRVRSSELSKRRFLGRVLPGTPSGSIDLHDERQDSPRQARTAREGRMVAHASIVLNPLKPSISASVPHRVPHGRGPRSAVRDGPSKGPCIIGVVAESLAVKQCVSASVPSSSACRMSASLYRSAVTPVGAPPLVPGSSQNVANGGGAPRHLYQYGRVTRLLADFLYFVGCERAFRNPLLDVSQAPAHGTRADADGVGEVTSVC